MTQNCASGTVKSWNGAKGFGFISDSTLGGDIFFSRAELPEDAKEVQGTFLTGRPVVFDAAQNPDGRYKATAVVVPFVEGQSLAGRIKSFSDRNGYGFITSSSLTEDVRFQKTDLPTVGPGVKVQEQLVTFEVTRRPDGKLMATKVRFQSRRIADRVGAGGDNMMGGGMGMGSMGMGGMGMGGMGMGGMGMGGMGMHDGGFMHGTIKSYSEKNGYGFINFHGYPADIKFGRHDLSGVANVTAGSAVTFTLNQTMDGRMTATNVFPLAAGDVVGTVKSYSEKNGYGFLTVPGYPMDIKFGRGDVSGTLNRGDDVSFSCSQTIDGRMVAQNLVPLVGGKGMKRSGDGAGSARAKKARMEEVLTGQSGSGIIKSYNSAKGFGFISGLDMQEDVFFLKTALPVTSQNLQGQDLKGKKVVFEIAQTGDGKVRAQNIQMS